MLFFGAIKSARYVHGADDPMFAPPNQDRPIQRLPMLNRSSRLSHNVRHVVFYLFGRYK